MANVVLRSIFNRTLTQIGKSRQFVNHKKIDNVFIVHHLNNRNLSQSLQRVTQKNLHCLIKTQFGAQQYSDDSKSKNNKLSLLQRFKQMYKEYWYVLVPVHITTSAVWFSGFYYLAKSGVDIPAFLESWHVSEKIVNPLKDSSMGYVAVAYALYKIATPARYTVTLGGSTISINYLKKWGYIKPVPSTDRLREIYNEKKENLMETMKETRVEFKNKSEKLKDKKDDIMDEVDKSIKKIKEISEKMQNHEPVADAVKRKEEKKKVK